MGDISSVIRVSAGGKDRLNAMYMVDGYGENNPIVVKSQFIMSLVERIDPNGVGPQQKSIIDRCVAAVYQEAEQSGTVPTLSTLREMLLDQPEEKAKDMRWRWSCLPQALWIFSGIKAQSIWTSVWLCLTFTDWVSS